LIGKMGNLPDPTARELGRELVQLRNEIDALKQGMRAVRILEGMINEGHIAVGAITAEKLAATLILASKIIAGNPVGARFEIDGLTNDFRVFRPDGTTTTLHIEGDTGDITMSGEFKTAESGERIVINSELVDLRTIRFYKATGEEHGAAYLAGDQMFLKSPDGELTNRRSHVVLTPEWATFSVGVESGDPNEAYVNLEPLEVTISSDGDVIIDADVNAFVHADGQAKMEGATAIVDGSTFTIIQGGTSEFHADNNRALAISNSFLYRYVNPDASSMVVPAILAGRLVTQSGALHSGITTTETTITKLSISGTNLYSIRSGRWYRFIVSFREQTSGSGAFDQWYVIIRRDVTEIARTLFVVPGNAVSDATVHMTWQSTATEDDADFHVSIVRAVGTGSMTVFGDTKTSFEVWDMGEHSDVWQSVP
jgi:hypothetical protein